MLDGILESVISGSREALAALAEAVMAPSEMEDLTRSETMVLRSETSPPRSSPRPEMEKRRRMMKQLVLVLASPKGTEKSLRLSEMELEQIPDLVWEHWNHLHYLDLSNNRLTRLPRRIRRMRRLIRLSLGKNQLKELPAELGHLQHLQWLDFTHNQLNGLPDTLVNLPQLSSLGASDCQFTTFPPVICAMSQLRKLGFFSNLISELPSHIGNLTLLNKLDLSGNCLTSLPAEIGKLTELTWLNLSNNRLEFLPAELGNLTKLTELGLSGNRLKALPDLSGLTSLTLLPLYNNCLQSLDDWVGRLPLLTQLEVSGNQLTELPASLWSSPLLSVVNLRGNRLTSLPEYWGAGADEAAHPEQMIRGCHPGLQLLDLRDNQLSFIPWTLLGPRMMEIKAANNRWQMELPQSNEPCRRVSLFDQIALQHTAEVPDHLRYRLTLLKPTLCACCQRRFLHQPTLHLEPRESSDGEIISFLVNLCSPQCHQRFNQEIEGKMRIADELFQAMEVEEGDLEAYYGPIANASTDLQ